MRTYFEEDTDVESFFLNLIKFRLSIYGLIIYICFLHLVVDSMVINVIGVELPF